MQRLKLRAGAFRAEPKHTLTDVTSLTGPRTRLLQLHVYAGRLRYLHLQLQLQRTAVGAALEDSVHLPLDFMLCGVSGAL